MSLNSIDFHFIIDFELRKESSIGWSLKSRLLRAHLLFERRSRSRSLPNFWAPLALTLTFFPLSAARARAHCINERRSYCAHQTKVKIEGPFIWPSEKLKIEVLRKENMVIFSIASEASKKLQVSWPGCPKTHPFFYGQKRQKRN